MAYRFDPAEPGSPLQLTRSVSGGKPLFFECVVEFKPTRTELRDYEGTYLSDEVDVIYRVSLRQAKLVLSRFGRKPVSLEPVKRDVFRAPKVTWVEVESGWVEFRRDSNNRVSGLVLDSYRNRNFRFTKQTP